MKSGTLYVLPNFLGKQDPLLMTGNLAAILRGLEYFVVEEIRSARQLLARMDKSIDIGSLHFFELNEHTAASDVAVMLKPLEQGKDMGIVSEAGCAAVADPGAALVRLAQEKNIRVVPVTGPSSILLALMASGLNGQAFSFEGYLPKERAARVQKIRELEAALYRTKQTKVFIETPYRNNHLLDDLVSVCRPGTLLCIASNIQDENESIRTRSMQDWKKELPRLDKMPTVFLMGLAE